MLNTYGMCFHPNSAGCPITGKLPLHSAKLSTSAGEATFRGRFSPKKHPSTDAVPTTVLNSCASKESCRRNSPKRYFHLQINSENSKDYEHDLFIRLTLVYLCHEARGKHLREVVRFCFTFGAERKISHGNSNQPQPFQPFVCVNHSKKCPLSHSKLHLGAVHEVIK